MPRGLIIPTLVLLSIVAACQGTATPAPTSTAIPAVVTAGSSPAAPTRSPSAVNTSPKAGFPPPYDLAQFPAVTTAAPTWAPAVGGLTTAFPAGTSIDPSGVWFAGRDGIYQSILAVPYRTADGAYQFALVGQPWAGLNKPWDGKTQTILWDWKEMGMELRSWRYVTYSPVEGTFLGIDAQGRNWLVFWDLPGHAVSMVAPVANSKDFRARLGWGGLLVRDGPRLVYYRIENRRAVEQWSTDQVRGDDFSAVPLTDDKDGNHVIDFNGDQRSELVIYWGDTLAQVYTREGEGFRLLGELPAHVQSARVEAGLFFSGAKEAFLAPDSVDNPSRWQVYRWVGGAIVKQETLPRPKGAQPVTLAAGDPLPPLPEDLYFTREIGWYRITKAGGEPSAVRQQVRPAPGCRSDETIQCESPGGRYWVYEHGTGAEGTIAAIKDQWGSGRADVPGTFVYSSGFNAFGWVTDGRYALLAQGDSGVVLDRVVPTTGKREPVLAISACGPDKQRCTFNFGATDPVMFPDGSYGFSAQSARADFYPPPGVYRLALEGNLSLLAAIPLTRQCGAAASAEDMYYGKVSWSSDRSFFIYTGARNPACPDPTVILGRSDGSAAWDLTALLQGAQNFHWAGDVTIQ